MVVASAVEGAVDEAVVARLIAHVGGEPGTIYGASGKPNLLCRLQAYDHAAQYLP